MSCRQALQTIYAQIPFPQLAPTLELDDAEQLRVALADHNEQMRAQTALVEQLATSGWCFHADSLALLDEAQMVVSLGGYERRELLQRARAALGAGTPVRYHDGTTAREMIL